MLKNHSDCVRGQINRRSVTDEKEGDARFVFR